MATQLDVYKSAIDFAFDTISTVNQKSLLASALVKFESAGLGDGDWEFWITTVNNQRGVMQQLASRKAALATAKPAQTTEDVKG